MANETVKKLIKLATTIVESEGDNSLVLAEYLKVFEEFDPLKNPQNNERLKTQLNELVRLHQAVIQKVEEEKQEVKSRLTSLRQKGKVVIRYTDQLPRSISLKTRKKI